MRLSEFETYDESPFEYEGVVMKLRRIVKEDDVVLLGEKKRPAVLSYTNDAMIPADTLEYRKIYVNSLTQVSNFSTPALKVWCFVLTKIRPKKERVFIPNRELMLFCGYSAMNTAYLGLFELLQNKFICRATGESCYWINPNKMYNGKRGNKGMLAELPEYIEENKNFMSNGKENGVQEQG